MDYQYHLRRRGLPCNVRCSGIRGSPTWWLAVYTHNVANEYLTVAGNDITHDDAGNMTTDRAGYQYEYDYENRLTRIEQGTEQDPCTVADYTYDALGRRVEKLEYDTSGAPSSTTQYYYDGWRVLRETNPDDSDVALRDYIYGNYIDEVLVMVDDPDGTDTDYFFGTDHLFSVVVLFDPCGNVVERYEYDAYGTCHFLAADFSPLSPQESTYGNPIAFTGRRLDQLDDGDLKIYYYRNRYYDPTTGRFISHDPLGVRDGVCLVQFARIGSPVFARTFRPSGQYRDGMSLYEYAASVPARVADPHGTSLLSLYPRNTACCKVKKTSWQIVGTFGPLPIMGKRTACWQSTISNPKGFAPKAACKCKYKGKKNVTVYDAHVGPCCSCRLYLQWLSIPGKTKEWAEDIPLLEQQNHARLYAECDPPGASWMTEDRGNIKKFWGQSTLSVWTDEPHPWRQHKGRLLGITSCTTAQKWLEKVNKGPKKRFYCTVGRNCWDYAKNLAKQIKADCP